MESNSVFQYSDFQAYLRDWFEHAKQSRRGISLQTVATKLGLKSRSHLHHILHDANPPFSESLVPKLIELLALRPREAEYFTTLVDFHRADTLTQKNQAYRRMHAMLALRMLQRDSKGKWAQTSPVVDTSDDLMSLAIYNFQMETLELAKIALEQLDRSDREISAMTFAIPAKSFGTVGEAMRKARDQIVQTVLEQGESCDQAFHMNLQCFPLKRKK